MPHTAEIVVENLDADKRPLAATADFHELFHVVAVTIGENTSTTVLPVVREVRDQYINIQQPPASTAVEVRRLVRDDLLIEVEAVAAIASFQPMTATA